MTVPGEKKKTLFLTEQKRLAVRVMKLFRISDFSTKEKK
jgi:hypothetical protein